MLSLDDARWKQLSQRMGDAYPFVTDALKRLSDNPHDQELFDELIPHLCSEGTTYDSAHAAAPYIIEFARQLSPKERANYLIWIGIIVIDSCPVEDIDDFLREDYKRALKDAMPLLFETLNEQHKAYETKYLLAALAALKGFTRLGEILENLDTYCFCDNCDNEIFDYEEVMNQEPD